MNANPYCYRKFRPDRIERYRLYDKALTEVIAAYDRLKGAARSTL